MKPDELHALADALEPMAKAPRFEDFDVPAFCAWVRACADAQPVAWRCEVRGDGTDPQLGAGDWRHYHTTTSKREAQAFVARCGNGIEGRAVPLYPRAAAPQADAMLKAREAA